ncbi:DUF116 domain-containing protein [Propionigenium maris]|uniref:DUF116 domain-containing protein n=1 Tax=Propionigenium maris TaxID=45622 RepID=UPI0024922A81|nr:DUF116 domain-containing protein [Propionigenium maris]
MERVVKNLLVKTVYSLGYFSYLIGRRISKSKDNMNISHKLVHYNNEFVLRGIKDKRVEKVAILLPHCIQNYNCPHKVTSEIENCKKCGICKIGDLLELKERYNIVVKVATGGTLARKFISEEKPSLVIAVACERDLISGIYDALPVRVYGVFNRRPNGPCIDTDVSIEEIKKVLSIIWKK